jgi:hypothetical protein
VPHHTNSRSVVVLLAVACLGGLASPAAAQSARPAGRVSFFTNSSKLTPDDGTATSSMNQWILSATFELTEGEGNGPEYALDVRRSAFLAGTRSARLSVYDAFAGGRALGGRVRGRVGAMWLTELGGLGSVAGALVEARQSPTKSALGRFRTGVFYGLEPDPFAIGDVPGVRKWGAYGVLDGAHGRRHSGGYIRLENHGLVERSVVAASNFVPIQSRVFLYQSSEYDLVGPAGQGSGGLTYFFINGRVQAAKRVDVQGNYHRGRSVDTRSIADDVLSGRPVPLATVQGLLYESAGTRVTVEVLPRVRVNAGYTRDRNNRDSMATARVTTGVSASDVAGSGIDVTVSDSRTNQAAGRFGSRYVSIGRQFGRALYLSSDYSSSLSVVRFTRSDGIIVESRPSTRQIGLSSMLTLSRRASLLVTVERTRDNTSSELRALTGLTYRIR